MGAILIFAFKRLLVQFIVNPGFLLLPWLNQVPFCRGHTLLILVLDLPNRRASVSQCSPLRCSTASLGFFRISSVFLNRLLGSFCFFRQGIQTHFLILTRSFVSSRNIYFRLGPGFGILRNPSLQAGNSSLSVTDDFVSHPSLFGSSCFVNVIDIRSTCW